MHGGEAVGGREERTKLVVRRLLPRRSRDRPPWRVWRRRLHAAPSRPLGARQIILNANPPQTRASVSDRPARPWRVDGGGSARDRARWNAPSDTRVCLFACALACVPAAPPCTSPFTACSASGGTPTDRQLMSTVYAYETRSVSTVSLNFYRLYRTTFVDSLPTGWKAASSE